MIGAAAGVSSQRVGLFQPATRVADGAVDCVDHRCESRPVRRATGRDGGGSAHGGVAMERMSLSERDLHRMLRIVSGPDEGDDGEPFPWSVLADLAKVIGVDSLVFEQL